MAPPPTSHGSYEEDGTVVNVSLTQGTSKEPTVRMRPCVTSTSHRLWHRRRLLGGHLCNLSS